MPAATKLRLTNEFRGEIARLALSKGNKIHQASPLKFTYYDDLLCLSLYKTKALKGDVLQAGLSLAQY